MIGPGLKENGEWKFREALKKYDRIKKRRITTKW